MLSHFGFAEMGVLLVIAMFVFGPERLPTIAADAGKGLRKARVFLKQLTDELKGELGPEIGDLDLRSLHPKEFVRKHLLEDEEPAPVAVSAAAVKVPLGPGEPAPWDPDTT